jgi:chemotaxis response regulator CheB
LIAFLRIVVWPPKLRLRPWERSSVITTVIKSVLIVDDNAFIREALRRVFDLEADFEVCGEAANGREAIERAQALRPDLIVLDLSMPVMNGFDAARVLKRLLPTVPLIMYSAFGDTLAKYQARLIGIWEFPKWSQNPSMHLC